METGDSLENQHGKDQLLQANRPCSRFDQGSLIECTTIKSLDASYVKCKHETFRTESNISK
jgi:hypothetical protein